MPKKLQRIRRSLFTKLAAVMILAVIAISSLYIAQVRGLQYGRATSVNRNFAEYVELLVQQLGSPPNRDLADAMGKRLRMRIKLEGPESWEAGRTDLRIPEKWLLPRFATDAVQEFSLHGFYRFRVTLSPDSVITFDIFPTEEERIAQKRYGFVSLVGFVVIMLLLYLVTRYMLQPVVWLKKGAEKVRDGNLDYRVPEKQRGELRELSETFNEMTARIEYLVESQQQLLYGVSHELRTPLTRLKLRLEMMEQTSGTEAIQRDLRKMETMINALLDSARMNHSPESLSKSPVDVGELLTGLVEHYHDRVPSVQLSLPASPVITLMDKDKMAVLISNLLENAVKYSAEDSAPVEVSLMQRENIVEIQVKDFGKGIPSSALPHLFEPFYRVDESRTRETGGYGLGLHLCHAVAVAHGGEILVESQIGKGTVMTVRIPVEEVSGV